MNLPSAEVLSSVAWVALLLAFLASVVRRCCRTTSSGYYHEFFQENGESDEPERIRRIDVMLLMVQYLLRGTWFSSMALMRAQGVGWYLGTDLGSQLAQWWPIWLAIELVFIGLIVSFHADTSGSATIAVLPIVIFFLNIDAKLLQG